MSVSEMPGGREKPESYKPGLLQYLKSRLMKKKPGDNDSHINDPQLSDPYATLAAIYDQVMQHVGYEHWARYIKKIIKNYSSFPTQILDIGCGTGEFIQEMRRLDIAVDGCDPSPAMLEIARRKNRLSNLWIDRLPTLNQVPPGRYQVMTCLYDTINYITSLEILEEALHRIYDLLPAEGIFVFDAVSEIFCQNYFDGFNERERIDSNFSYERNSYYDYANQCQINEFSIFTPRQVFKERHVQHIFSFSEIRSSIVEKTKFDLVAFYEDFTFFDAEEDSNRAHFILKK